VLVLEARRIEEGLSSFQSRGEQKLGNSNESTDVEAFCSRMFIIHIMSSSR